MLPGGNLVIWFAWRGLIGFTLSLSSLYLVQIKLIPQKKTQTLAPRREQTLGIVLENPPLLRCLVIPCEVYSLGCELGVNLFAHGKNSSRSQLPRARKAKRRRRDENIDAAGIQRGAAGTPLEKLVAERRFQFQETADGQGGNEEFSKIWSFPG